MEATLPVMLAPGDLRIPFALSQAQKCIASEKATARAHHAEVKKEVKIWMFPHDRSQS